MKIGGHICRSRTLFIKEQSNLDCFLFQETVVHASNRLSIYTLQLAGGSWNKQTIEFVKACVTFNGITIPSITSIIPRIHLFLETAEVGH